MGFEVIQGDCLEVMRGMADSSVDVVLTDPPYASGGLHVGARRNEPKAKYTSAGHWSEQKEYPAYFGDSCDQMTWMLFARFWLLECFRLCRDGAHLYVFSDWRQLPATVTAMQMANWQYRGLVVWDKGNTARAAGAGLWRHGAEFVVWASKGKPWSLTGGEWTKGVAPTHNVIRADKPLNKEHITQKPVEVVTEILKVGCPEGGTVLDLFCGSGTTGVATVGLRCDFIGIEREAEYAEMSRRRIWAAENNAPLFAEAVA